jgi:putative ABC transport system permease protein
MDAQRLIVVFAMILLMCLGSAAMAMRKLADADPAEIF